MARTTDAPRSEHRWPVLLVTIAALSLHLLMPSTITLLPQWVVPVAGLIVVTPLVLINPRRLNRETRWSRWLGIGFALALTAINQVYVVQLVMELVNDSADGPMILVSALAVWITNVVAFALIYWQLDLGGPVQRRIQGRNDDAIQDFRFPQQDNREGQADWFPEFLDYSYFSLSNMMAFSPTDVMPLARWAKLTMSVQSILSIVILSLVVANAVNLLG